MVSDFLNQKVIIESNKQRDENQTNQQTYFSFAAAVARICRRERRCPSTVACPMASTSIWEYRKVGSVMVKQQKKHKKEVPWSKAPKSDFR